MLEASSSKLEFCFRLSLFKMKEQKEKKPRKEYQSIDNIKKKDESKLINLREAKRKREEKRYNNQTYKGTIVCGRTLQSQLQQYYVCLEERSPNECDVDDIVLSSKTNTVMPGQPTVVSIARTTNLM